MHRLSTISSIISDSKLRPSSSVDGSSISGSKVVLDILGDDNDVYLILATLYSNHLHVSLMFQNGRSGDILEKHFTCSNQTFDRLKAHILHT